MNNFRTDKTEKQFKFDDGSNIYFTSDTHFSHENIIRFCNRPFQNIEEMDKVLIDNWNRVVKPDDIIFHLGDFAWGGSSVWNTTLNKLNGRKYLIVGNHDEKNLRQGYENKFEWIGYQMHITIENRSIYLNHYPFLCYGGVYRRDEDKVWQLFGHVHTSPGASSKDSERLANLFPTQYDVGVDNNNYTPVSFHQVKDIIEKQININKNAE